MDNDITETEHVEESYLWIGPEPLVSPEQPAIAHALPSIQSETDLLLPQSDYKDSDDRKKTQSPSIKNKINILKEQLSEPTNQACCVGTCCGMFCVAIMCYLAWMLGR